MPGPPKNDLADAHYNWGNALLTQGKPTEAIEHFRQALAIRPAYAAAHHNWGVGLAQQGKRAEAMEHFQRALSIRQNTTPEAPRGAPRRQAEA